MKRKYLLITLLVTVVFFIFKLDQPYSQMSMLLEYRGYLDSKISGNPIRYGFIAFLILLISSALCLPILSILVLGNGFFLGMGWGTLVSSLGSSLGAVVTFLIARTILQRRVTTKMNRVFETMNKEFQIYGVLYILSLRLIPLVPFQLVNIVFGLTKVKLLTFFWSSQLGMLPSQIILVNAGVKMSEVRQIEEIFSFEVVLSLVLLGLIPLSVRAAKKFREKQS